MKKTKSIIDRLKAYYQAAEREAAKAAPYYVTEDGGLFANPREVIHAVKVRHQLRAFAELQSASKGETDAQQPKAATTTST